MVLWVLVLLGTTAAAVIAGTRFDLATTQRSRSALESYYAARAGVADALDRLMSGPIQGPAPRSAGASLGRREDEDPGVVLAFTDTAGRVAYDVRVLDVNSRVNVNATTAEILEALLDASGVGRDEAARLAQCIFDWIDPDELRLPLGAEAATYRREGFDYAPRNGPLPALEELLLVRGMSAAILYGGEGRDPLRSRLRGIAQWLTTEGSGRINLNTAPRAVLAALPGFTAAVVDLVIDLRREGPITSLSQISQDPRLAGAVSLQDMSIRLLQTVQTGTGLESVVISARAIAPDGPSGMWIEAGIDLRSGRPVVASWYEGVATR